VPVEMVQFLLKPLLKQTILSVYDRQTSFTLCEEVGIRNSVSNGELGEFKKKKYILAPVFASPYPKHLVVTRYLVKSLM